MGVSIVSEELSPPVSSLIGINLGSAVDLESVPGL